MRLRTLTLTVAFSLGLVRAASAQSPLVDLRDLSPRELRSASFVLTGTTLLSLDAVGAEPWLKDRKFEGFMDDENTWPAAAWIIDLRTRAVVWDLRTVPSERAGNDGLRRFTGTVELPAGVYQANFASYVATSSTLQGSLGDLIASRVRGRRNARVTYGGHYVDNGAYRRLQLTITGQGHAASDAEAAEASRAFFGSAFVSLHPTNAESVERAGFELTRPAEIDIYAIGELRRDGAFDYGWIQNADTRERVWQMEYGGTRAAGGASKNRLVRETLKLAAGRYIAYFASDDSHAPGDWNAVPAMDPDSWGLTLRIADPVARAAVRTFDWRPVPASGPVISIVGVGNDEIRSQGFRLTRPVDVRIYALGEGRRENSMDDYAWILDAGTRRVVWRMEWAQTTEAGGAAKNRLFDGAIKLSAGNYLLYYRSDDSHSYRQWNAAPPAEADYWGVSLFPASRADAAAFAEYQEPRQQALAQLLRVRNNKDWRAVMVLEKPSLIRIHAVGEGTGGMSDYGWIEEGETGRTVWKMTRELTVHAGGADKNRLFDGTIRLPAGRYWLHFETDGSHAYDSWNADPPDDPEAWGIAVYRVGD